MNDGTEFDFFFDAGSCSLAVRIVLEESGIPYTPHQVTARDHDRRTRLPEWLVRNPKGRVPALSPVGGRAGGQEGLLTEVPAILTYLARCRPDLDLLPADTAREARTLEWMNWLSGWVHSVCFSQLWRPERFTDDPATLKNVQSKGRENLLEAFGAVEHIFADGRIVAVPDSFTIADAFLLVFYRWGGLAGIDMAAYSLWTASALATAARPSVVRAFVADDLPSLI